jgi:alpha-beta hydrolase superfamily lysophospholipase
LTDQPIQYAESSDGTRIAYRRFGSGRPIVFVGGATSTAEAAGPLAAAFAEAGLQGVAYDRRGRGDSGDTAPYAPQRETEATTLLRGDPTVPLIVTAVEQLAAAMPGTELVVVPESHDHGVDPAGTVREVRARIG